MVSSLHSANSGQVTTLASSHPRPVQPLFAANIMVSLLPLARSVPTSAPRSSESSTTSTPTPIPSRLVSTPSSSPLHCVCSPQPLLCSFFPISVKTPSMRKMPSSEHTSRRKDMTLVKWVSRPTAPITSPETFLESPTRSTNKKLRVFR